MTKKVYTTKIEFSNVHLNFLLSYFLEFHSAYKIKQIANATASIKNHCGTPPKLMLTPRSKIFY